MVLWATKEVDCSILTMCLVDANAGNSPMRAALGSVLDCPHCLRGSNYTQSAACVLDLESAADGLRENKSYCLRTPTEPCDVQERPQK